MHVERHRSEVCPGRWLLAELSPHTLPHNPVTFSPLTLIGGSVHHDPPTYILRSFGVTTFTPTLYAYMSPYYLPTYILLYLLRSFGETHIVPRQRRCHQPKGNNNCACVTLTLTSIICLSAYAVEAFLCADPSAVTTCTSHVVFFFACLSAQVKKILNEGLKPVLCIGESKEEYEAG